MKISEDYSEHIKDVLEILVKQGLSAEMAEQAQECAGKMFRLIAEYKEPGIVALGIVGATVQELLEE